MTLLTDFGTKDPYVASMKGVLLSINPRCHLVDISHEVPAHDVEEGAYILLNAFSFFPKGTIHLGVVDPEVGGARKPILVVTERYFFVGPDNGLFAFALQQERPREVIHLTNAKYFRGRVSQTFHGRDLFAPVAGHLSLGVAPKAFGRPIPRWETLCVKEPVQQGERLVGEVLYVDRFGNLISNVSEARLRDFLNGGSVLVHAGGRRIDGLKKGYWDAEKGEAIALVGSGGFLEIAVREGSAARMLKIGKGDRLILRSCKTKGERNGGRKGRAYDF